MVNIIQPTNRRFVTVGPGAVSLGAAATAPQVYFSLRDTITFRGVHTVGTGLGATAAGAVNTLLPGMLAYDVATTNLTAPLIGSFVFEPNGLTLWTW